jgi:hypothetical protein
MHLFSEDSVIQRRTVVVVGIGVGSVDDGDSLQVTDLPSIAVDDTLWKKLGIDSGCKERALFITSSAVG